MADSRSFRDLALYPIRWHVRKIEVHDQALRVETRQPSPMRKVATPSAYSHGPYVPVLRMATL